MSYNVSNLIESLISLKNDGAVLYTILANSDSLPVRERTMASIFASEEHRHIGELKLIQKSLYHNCTEISDDIGIQIDELVLRMKEMISAESAINLNQMIEFATYFEKKIVDFLGVIQQDIFSKSISFLYSCSLLCNLIKDEKHHAREMKNIMKGFKEDQISMKDSPITA